MKVYPVQKVHVSPLEMSQVMMQHLISVGAAPAVPVGMKYVLDAPKQSPSGEFVMSFHMEQMNNDELKAQYEMLLQRQAELEASEDADPEVLAQVSEQTANLAEALPDEAEAQVEPSKAIIKKAVVKGSENGKEVQAVMDSEAELHDEAVRAATDRLSTQP